MFRRRYAHPRGSADHPVVAGRWQAARVVSAVAAVIAGVIVLGIVLVLLEANPRNDLVGAITDAARWLAGPFRGLFGIDDADWRVLVNWGLAALVYYGIGRLIAGMLAR